MYQDEYGNLWASYEDYQNYLKIASQISSISDDEIEKVEVIKKPKMKKNPWKVTWTKIIEKADDLYKSLNEDIDKENI